MFGEWKANLAMQPVAQELPLQPLAAYCNPTSTFSRTSFCFDFRLLQFHVRTV